MRMSTASGKGARSARAVLVAAAGLAFAILASGPVFADTIVFSQGFESGTTGWHNVVQVAGTSAIPASSGDYYASPTSTGRFFTEWGGYRSVFPSLGYSTSVDVYLDPGSATQDGARIDWDSAVNSTSGALLHHFVINGGFYDSSDSKGPGAGSDRFVFAASNSTGSSIDPTDSSLNPIAITASGWYTFQHVFTDVGGVLSADLSILDSSGSVLGDWTLSNPLDAITGVGGNRWGWFATNELPSLDIDNSRLVDFSTTNDFQAQAVPLPSSAPLALVFLLALGLIRSVRRRQRARRLPV